MGERSLKQTEELLERFVKVMKDRMIQQSAKHSGNDVIDDDYDWGPLGPDGLAYWRDEVLYHAEKYEATVNGNAIAGDMKKLIDLAILTFFLFNKMEAEGDVWKTHKEKRERETPSPKETARSRRSRNDLHLWPYPGRA